MACCFKRSAFEPIETTVQSTALAPAARDASGKIIRTDRSGEEALPVPAEQSAAYLSPDEGQAMVDQASQPHEGMPAYDELRSDIRDAMTVEQYGVAQSTVAALEKGLSGADFNLLNDVVGILPGNVQARIMVALGSGVFDTIGGMVRWISSQSSPLEQAMIQAVWNELPDHLLDPEDFEDDEADDDGQDEMAG